MPPNFSAKALLYFFVRRVLPAFQTKLFQFQFFFKFFLVPLSEIIDTLADGTAHFD